MRRFCRLFVAGLITASLSAAVTAAPDTQPAVKHPIPSAAAITAESKVVDSIFAPQAARAVTPAQKTQLSAKVL